MIAALAAGALAWAGFAALSLAADRHSGRRSRLQRRAMRLAAGIALCGSYAISAASAGPAIGLVEWLGMATCAALLQVVALSLVAGRVRNPG